MSKTIILNPVTRIGQVNMAVSEMDKVTQSNAANAEESASAAEELNAQAETLKEAVASLQQLVGGHGGQPRPTASKVVASRNHGSKRGSSQGHDPATAPQSNGGSKPASSAAPRKATARQTAGAAIPLEGDFKDF